MTGSLREVKTIIDRIGSPASVQQKLSWCPGETQQANFLIFYF